MVYINVRGNKVCDPGINKDGGVIDESSDSTNEGTSVSRSFDVALDGLVDQNEVSLEANRLKERAEVVALLTSGGHVGDPFPLEEEGRRIAVGIVEEREKLGGIFDQPGADFPARHGVERVIVVEGKQTKVLASIKGHLRRAAADLAAVLNRNTKLVGV